MTAIDEDTSVRYLKYSHLPWVLSDVELVVSKDDLNPQEVTERLGLTPTGTRLPGPSRWEPPGEEAGLWLFGCADRDLSLAEQLNRVLDAVEPRVESLQGLLSDGFDVTLKLVGNVGRGAMTKLPEHAVARVAALGIPLDVSVSSSAR